MPTQADLQNRLKAIERLLSEVEEEANPSLRANVQKLVQLVMDLHGAALERTLELLALTPEGGEQMVQKLGRDDLVSSVLILYGLHPLSLEARLNQALEKARLKLRAHESAVELLGIEGGGVRLRLTANGHGCGSTGQKLREIIEDTVYQYAPDLASLVIEGTENEADGKQGFIPLESLLKSPASSGFALAATEKGGA